MDVTDRSPRTLVIDLGGQGVEATVLGPDGEPTHDRVRIDTADRAHPAGSSPTSSTSSVPLPTF